VSRAAPSLSLSLTTPLMPTQSRRILGRHALDLTDPQEFPMHLIRKRDVTIIIESLKNQVRERERIPSDIFEGTLRIKSFLDLRMAAEKGRVHVSIAYKITPHAQSSNAKVISESSGGE